MLPNSSACTPGPRSRRPPPPSPAGTPRPRRKYPADNLDPARLRQPPPLRSPSRPPPLRWPGRLGGPGMRVGVRVVRIANRANREALYEIAESRWKETFFCLCGEVVQRRFVVRALCLRARVRTPNTLFLFVTFCFCVSGFIKFHVV